MNPSFKPIRIKEYSVMTMPKIIELNKEIKRKVNELKRVEIKWDILLKNAFFLEDIMESEHSIDWRIRSAFYVERRGKCGKFLDSLGKEIYDLLIVLEWLWHVRLRIIVNFIFGVMSIIGSVMIFMFEVFTFEEFNVINLNILSPEDGFIKTQVIQNREYFIRIDRLFDSPGLYILLHLLSAVPHEDFQFLWTLSPPSD
jgi:hypothetical protein